MAIEFGTFTDPRDGEVYKTIKVDGQEWLAENFRFKCRFTNSLDNDEANDKKYGRFYSGRIASMVAPEGWHLPTYDEFLKLAEALGSKKRVDLASTEGWEELNGTNSTGFNAQPLGYCEPNTSGSNVVVIQNEGGTFRSKGEIAAFWTSELNEPTPSYHSNFHAFTLRLNKEQPNYEINSKEDNWDTYDNYDRLSVRLVRNAESNYTPQFGTFTDERDGKTYKTVIIGKQEWFAENLSFNAEGSKVYEDNAENEKKYGRLYDLEAGLKAIPEGWKMPDRKDIKTLVDFIAATVNTTKYQVAPFLKSKEDWNIDGFFEGSDAVGFNALAAGIGESYKDGTYKFSGLGKEAYFRTATSGKLNRLWEREMDFKEPTGFCDYDLMSVRPFRPYKANGGTSKTTAKKEPKAKAEAPKATFETGSFTDPRDGQVYKTVKIGDQEWLAENLRFKTSDSKMYSGAKPYQEDGSTIAKYGLLYEWFDAILNAAPNGWRLPSLEDFDTLKKTLKTLTKCKKDFEGEALQDPNGFAATLGGWGRAAYPDFKSAELDKTGSFWTSSGKKSGSDAYALTLTKVDNSFKKEAVYNSTYLSVRLIKGQSTARPITGTFTDPRDSKVYKTIEVDGETWLAENLNYECEGARALNDDPENAKKYGLLYTWDVAMKAAPPGWHLPTEEEWNDFKWKISELAEGPLSYNSNVLLMSGSSSDWGSSAGLDFIGFSALPGGFIDENGVHHDKKACFWTATTYRFKETRAERIDIDSSGFDDYHQSEKTQYRSVRLVKDK